MIMNKQRKGCSIIFINDANQILLFLRDNKPTIPYPNMWDFLGGQIEEGETPAECIIREIKEEINLELKDVHYLMTENFPDRIEYVFYKRINLDISEIVLTEGQKIQWFTKEELEQMETVLGVNKIIDKFFEISLNSP